MNKSEQLDNTGWDREGLVRRLNKVLDLQEEAGPRPPLTPEEQAMVLKVVARVAEKRARERQG